MAEEYFLRKGMKENFGFLLKMGGIFSRWTCALYAVTAIVQTVFFFCTAYLRRDDIEVLTSSLHFALLGFVISPSLIFGRIYKKNIKTIFIAIGKGFYDYGETLTEECIREKRKIIQRVKKNKIRSIAMYFVYLSITGGMVMLIRPILNDAGDLTENYPVHGRLPMNCWYPLDVSQPSNFLLCSSFQVVFIILSPGITVQMVVTFFTFSEEFIGQMDIIFFGLKNSFERAEKLYENEMKESKKKEFDIEIFNRCLRICLNHSMKHHQDIMRLFNEFNQIYFYILFFLMVGATFLLGLAGINFMSPDVSTKSKIQFFLILILELVTIFIYCFNGERLSRKSSAISFAIYESDWFQSSRAIKAYFLIVYGQCLKPLKFNAGGFMDASLLSFSRILSTAYSYFNVLKLMNE